MKFLDCTFRDGGYYNNWDFPEQIIQQYLYAMESVNVDVVELGFRSLQFEEFKGACAYTTDSFISSLSIPEKLQIGVMVNGSELVGNDQFENCKKLFPNNKSSSPVDVVRIACHVHEFKSVLPVSKWLKDQGYLVGFNLMQVSDRTAEEIKDLAKAASEWPIDVLYFADSMGGMTSSQVANIIEWLKINWTKDLGIHTHDNIGLALSNSLSAANYGVKWLDSTVTGMGRGPGNAKTEYLAIELAHKRDQDCNLVPLMNLIANYFEPLKNEYGWGSNSYYYLAGKYGIHPSFVQTMLSDNRYSEEDILAVIDRLKKEGGKKFSFNTLDASRRFYLGEPRGNWKPKELLANRNVLILGTGPGVETHRSAIESYIKSKKPVVIALNTQSKVDSRLINFHIACHPVRLLADCKEHVNLPQPLIVPSSMLPSEVKESLTGKDVFDYGLSVEENQFEFGDSYCIAPTSLVIAYALSVCTSGQANKIFLAGFDGYKADDPRNNEMNKLLGAYFTSKKSRPVISITPTRYELKSTSVYALAD